MPTVWLMLLANVRSSLAVLTCCEPCMSGYATPGPTWPRPPVSRVEWDPREKYAGVGFRMVNNLLTPNG